MMLYIHLPFCKAKCGYCAFCSDHYPEQLQADYVDTLCKMLAHHGTGKKMTTVYIGGGTPSVLPLALWKLLLTAVKPLLDNTLQEFTVELNPESTTPELLSLLQQNGVNRVSFGVQSMNDAELAAIGRLHTAERARWAVDLAASMGFDNISVDLIYGLPGQTTDSFSRSLRQVLALPVSHLSCYNLQLEEGTPLFLRQTQLSFPDEDSQEEMYQQLLRLTKQAGFAHYEISNFALPGRRAVHNSGYWTGKDYLGLGAAAHSKLGNCRYSFAEDVPAFAAKTNFDFDECITLTEVDQREEAVMLGLRTDAGAPLALLERTIVDKYISFGLGSIVADRFVLNDRGFMLSNTIIADLL